MLLDRIRGPSGANSGHLNLVHLLSILRCSVIRSFISSKSDLSSSCVPSLMLASLDIEFFQQLRLNVQVSPVRQAVIGYTWPWCSIGIQLEGSGIGLLAVSCESTANAVTGAADFPSVSVSFLIGKVETTTMPVSVK